MTAITNNYATVHAIPNEDLGDVMALIFPNHFLQVEMAHYATLEQMTADYTGGVWTGYTNEERTIFFLVPPAQDYHLLVKGNYYEGTVNAETAGIITSLVVLNQLVWSTHDPVHNELFYNLRNFALEHPHCESILAAID